MFEKILSFLSPIRKPGTLKPSSYSLVKPGKSSATIIHAKGLPCPDGFYLVQGAFIQSDGTREDAYVDAYSEKVVIDVLRPGESITLAKVSH